MSARPLLVSERQKGNPLLKHLKNVPWKHDATITPDYVLGDRNCAVFISIRYHMLKPQYLGRRLAELRAEGSRWRLRVLLCLVDVEDATKALHELNILALRMDCVLFLAHGPQEAARYLECFKAYEKNSAQCIRERVDPSHAGQVADALQAIKPLNRTDVATLSNRFATFGDLLRANLDDLRACPGLGDKKCSRLHDAFARPFDAAPAAPPVAAPPVAAPPAAAPPATAPPPPPETAPPPPPETSPDDPDATQD